MKPEVLERSLGVRFSRQELLLQAITHRSHSTPHNERLEFLGDGILNFVAADLLFRKFPGCREGELSRMRATLVRQESLFEIAQILKLGDYLRLGEGELKSGGFRRPSILADALEAIFGAIYLDGGFANAYDAIARLLQPRIDVLDPKASPKDAKTELQEWLQGRRLGLPRYTLCETRGDAHAQEFEVECAVPELSLVYRGLGGSRRLAEQAAAQAVLEKVKTS